LLIILINKEKLIRACVPSAFCFIKCPPKKVLRTPFEREDRLSASSSRRLPFPKTLDVHTHSSLYFRTNSFMKRSVPRVGKGKKNTIESSHSRAPSVPFLVYMGACPVFVLSKLPMEYLFFEFGKRFLCCHIYIYIYPCFSLLS
jgi:hypothetical protein